MDDRDVSDVISLTRSSSGKIRIDAVDRLISLGKDGNQMAIDRIIELTEDGDPLVSSRARSALSRISWVWGEIAF